MVFHCYLTFENLANELCLLCLLFPLALLVYLETQTDYYLLYRS
jgi:hypothetical protein